ncbi:M20 family metallopeptidase [Halobacterium wangiae]|uniref:M20 family metallopeptidase n=1 Tax=Halobacterium wangiae TaxID=2902623 RepID=UPI001E43663B|nr:ArgE/DapE family deacylase [Halobacterium wangiae]
MTASTPPEYVEAHRGELLALTEDLVAMDTANPPGNTAEIVEYVGEYLASLGVDAERFEVDPAKPNLLATVPGARPETLLFNGHFDTVPFDEEAWTYDPLGEVVDDRLYGRGTTDMKGAVAAMLFAIRAFVETDTRPPVTLTFAFVSDEEVSGDAGLPALLDADRLVADGCVIGEPTCESGQHSVTVADRGSIWLTLEATGEAAHGSRPMVGVNAIDRLYDAVTVVRSRFGSRTLEVDETMQPIVEESIDYYAPKLGADTARGLFEHPSINLGTLHGGEAINSVPQSATAELDVRVVAGVQTPEVVAGIRECVAGCEGVTIADVSWSVGTVEPVDSPLVEAVSTTAEDVVGERVYRRSATGGGDAKKLRNAGIPTVEFALGSDTVHAVDEYVDVDAIVDNAVVYARLPTAWLAEFR